MTHSAPQLGLPDSANPWLAAFLRRVYVKMTAGLVLAAAAAWCVANVGALRNLLFQNASGGEVGLTVLGLVVLFSPLAILFVASFFPGTSGRAAALIYWSVAGLVGASLGLLVLTFIGAELVSTFLVTAAAFASLSAWGYATGRSLMGWGAFFEVALVGLIVAMAVNLAFPSSAAYLVLNLIGVVIFAGLIASDTQRLKAVYYEAAAAGALDVAENYGALTLYLNFINLFEFLLALSGRRRR